MILTKSDSLSDLAAGYLAGGLSLFPTSRTDKRPGIPSFCHATKGAKPGWKLYQERPADAATVKSWFARGCQSVAAVAGKVSGGLLIIDFDVARFFDAWCERVGSLAEGLPVQRTGREGGGFQFWFRCPDPGHNDKLAHVPDASEETGRRVAIETRAEGGYAVAPGCYTRAAGVTRWWPATSQRSPPYRKPWRMRLGRGPQAGRSPVD